MQVSDPLTYCVLSEVKSEVWHLQGRGEGSRKYFLPVCMADSILFEK